MKKLLLLTIFAALLSVPQVALGYGDDNDGWYEQQKIEWQQRETERRLREIEWQQRKIESRQDDIESQQH